MRALAKSVVLVAFAAACAAKQEPAPASVTAAPTLAPTSTAATAATSKVSTCAAGTVLAWADNESAKCLRPCDGTDAACAKGTTCVPGNGVDDAGNPIPHDVIDVCLASSAAPLPPTAAKVLAPPPGTMETANPGHPPCPAGYDDQGGVLDTCNKKCKGPKDCNAPFTCQSLTGDPTKVCADMKHIHSRQ
jgi:hypothetical protein